MLEMDNSVAFPEILASLPFFFLELQAKLHIVNTGVATADKQRE